LSLTVAFLFCLPLAGCEQNQPLRIGFVGELTSRSAGLSTSGRNGFLLAIEEINRRGGIEGHAVEGVVRDTQNRRSKAIAAIQQLARMEVKAIVGPMTSTTAVAIVPLVNELGIPMVSPTVSTNTLSGLDDYFLRVYYNNAQAAELLAGHLVIDRGLTDIAVIYDLGNRAYTEDWVDRFEQSSRARSKVRLVRLPFDFRSDTLFGDLARQAIRNGAQAVLLLANAVDSAMICQQLAKAGATLPIYATGWSYSDDLIQFGGRSIEGLTIIQSASLQNRTAKLDAFTKAYQNRFHTPPTFPALHAYDATQAILSVLTPEATPAEIRNALLTPRALPGLQGDFRLDRFGDLEAPELHLARIKNGRFVEVD
jgi:branched-chain amino acid transport system substrate-binding protein